MLSPHSLCDIISIMVDMTPIRLNEDQIKMMIVNYGVREKNIQFIHLDSKTYCNMDQLLELIYPEASEANRKTNIFKKWKEENPDYIKYVLKILIGLKRGWGVTFIDIRKVLDGFFAQYLRGDDGVKFREWIKNFNQSEMPSIDSDDIEMVIENGRVVKRPRNHPIEGETSPKRQRLDDINLACVIDAIQSGHTREAQLMKENYDQTYALHAKIAELRRTHEDEKKEIKREAAVELQSLKDAYQEERRVTDSEHQDSVSTLMNDWNKKMTSMSTESARKRTDLEKTHQIKLGAMEELVESLNQTIGTYKDIERKYNQLQKIAPYMSHVTSKFKTMYARNPRHNSIQHEVAYYRHGFQNGTLSEEIIHDLHAIGFKFPPVIAFNELVELFKRDPQKVGSSGILTKVMFYNGQLKSNQVKILRQIGFPIPNIM